METLRSLCFRYIYFNVTNLVNLYSLFSKRVDSIFRWTEKELEFLRKNIEIFKNNIEAESADCESLRTKY